MTTTPTQQPEALKLADVLHEVASLFGFPYALLQSATELRFQHAEIARLTAENMALRSAVSEAAAAEREACAELMEQQHTWITNVAASALIRARGTP